LVSSKISLSPHSSPLTFHSFILFMYTDLEGYYLDGRTAIRHRARVRLTPQELQIVLENGYTTSWPLKEIRQPKNFYGDEQIRLERGGDIAEVLLVPGYLFLKKLKNISPEGKRRFHAPARRKKLAMAVLLSALGAMGVLAGLYLWGIPALASFLAPHIPVAWEESLGQSVVSTYAPAEKRCLDSARAQKVEKIVARLASTVPEAPYSFRVIVVNHPSVNAFAVPGGTMVVFQGLLEKTRTPEELAGVLAHEMQHILRRHATRALLQQVSMKVLLAAAVGDAKGLSYGLEGAQALGMLRYSRQSEEEADQEGIRMLIAAGINPRGLPAFLETIQGDGEKSLKLPAYLSTHPDLEVRIQRLKNLTVGAAASYPPLLPNYDWKDIYGFCPAKPKPNSR
jgi:Zn-dependent protease with chaperone function